MRVRRDSRSASSASARAMVMMPLFVAGQDRAGGDRHIGEEAEGEAVRRVFVARLERQAQAQQGIEQALLGALDDLPAATG